MGAVQRMSYGLNISAGGLMTSIYAQEVYANNLANMDTPGFKADVPSALVRQPVTKEDNVGYLPSNALLERLTGGTLLNANRVDFSQGSLKATGNSLDLAIEGDGFFVLRDAMDRQGDTLRLTRDGRFSLGPDGTLRNISGMAVLDSNNRAIRLERGAATVAADGTIRQRGAEVARLKVVDVADRAGLRKLDKGQFAADSRALSGAAPATGRVHQNAIEDSAADEIQMLLRMNIAARDVENNASMIQAHDRLMDRAINGLGRLA